VIKHLAQLRNVFIYRWYRILSRLSQSNLPVNPLADFVVSIASYPKRDPLVPAVFQALSRQTVLPQKWILVLSEEDYLHGLPKHLQQLVRRGLEILWVRDNAFAVKKLVPVVEKYPDLAIVTLDDDLLYGSKVLEQLVEASKHYPAAIIGHVGKEIHRKGNMLGMYYRSNSSASLKTDPSRVYFLGGSGTYYPPMSLDKRFMDLKAIQQIVPGRGSDIWFWAAAVAAGTKQICLGTNTNKELYIPIPQNKDTSPKDTPSRDVMEERFQKAIDYFGIREKLLAELPDLSDPETK
jgi:hypothetical protein